jgi:hypothetical protein
VSYGPLVNAQDGQSGPVHVLRQAIAEALPRLPAIEPDTTAPGAATAEVATETVNAVLLAFTKAAAPFANELTARAARHPDGPLATAMGYPRDAFARLSAGDVSPARTAVMAVAQSELDQLA